MAVFVKAICLLAAFCFTIEAKNDTRADPAKKQTPPASPPQNQFDFVFSIYNQTTPIPESQTTTRMTRPSTGNQATIQPNIVGGSTSIYDDSSEEESDTDTDDGEVQSAPSYVFKENGNRVSGNTRPMSAGWTRQRAMTGVRDGDLVGDYEGGLFGVHDHLVGRATGSSARGVGIALGLLGLLTVVIAAAFLIIRKQRSNNASFVRI
ncbi:uncharacterized protein LOC135154118 [Lytechinus pictus]|uniref:uncharacterized protein LOC135154118 n=1 Tax=Lytechinus pictus TaxID=7653 RepID=UPI0030B9F297